MRMHMNCFARLSNALSKKLDNHMQAMANFYRFTNILILSPFPGRWVSGMHNTPHAVMSQCVEAMDSPGDFPTRRSLRGRLLSTCFPIDDRLRHRLARACMWSGAHGKGNT
jgi:hypothetical protein